MDCAPRTLLAVFGTRPEAIKMAPLIRCLSAGDHFQVRVCVTAQHREMLDQVLKLFAIEPDYDLDIMQTRQTLAGITCRSLRGLADIYKKESPDMVLVHGDTTTTFTGALAAYYQKRPVGHVEAGLRTGDKYRPFPEEVNRHLTGVLSDLHFAPTERAAKNLKAENVDPETIVVTGNTVIDALLSVVEGNKGIHLEDELEPVESMVEKREELVRLFAGRENGNQQNTPHSRPLLLVTAHRRENLGQPLRQICEALLGIKERFGELSIVFPLHLNPRVRETVLTILGGKKDIHLIEPPGYGPFACLMQASDLILTDSGGIQEEAPALGKPVLVLREVTERPEAVEAGTARLVGTDPGQIMREVTGLLADSETYRRMSRATNPYGDGRACERIYRALLSYFKDA